jgi:hypothetical protein
LLWAAAALPSVVGDGSAGDNPGTSGVGVGHARVLSIKLVAKPVLEN